MIATRRQRRNGSWNTRRSPRARARSTCVLRARVLRSAATRPVDAPALLLACAALFTPGCEHRENPLRVGIEAPEGGAHVRSFAETTTARAARSVRHRRTTHRVEIVPRTPDIPSYPCSTQCHNAREPDPTPRTLSTFHGHLTLDHAPGITWCDRCHALDDPDRFRLIEGATVAFDASDQVCGQCHGEKHRSWSEGVHGTQTGSWRDVAKRRTCTACHDPHQPDDIHFEALPPPAFLTRGKE